MVQGLWMSEEKFIANGIIAQDSTLQNADSFIFCGKKEILRINPRDIALLVYIYTEKGSYQGIENADKKTLTETSIKQVKI
jgi:hypothetical protein